MCKPTCTSLPSKKKEAIECLIAGDKTFAITKWLWSVVNPCSWPSCRGVCTVSGHILNGQSSVLETGPVGLLLCTKWSVSLLPSGYTAPSPPWGASSSTTGAGEGAGEGICKKGEGRGTEQERDREEAARATHAGRGGVLIHHSLDYNTMAVIVAWDPGRSVMITV